MRRRDFLQQVADQVTAALPVNYGQVQTRHRSSLIQFWYTRPRIHYEVWLQARRQRVEVGLHLEDKKRLNDRLLRYLADRFVAVQAALGPEVEVEQWTRSWGRIHRFVAYDKLSVAVSAEVAAELVGMIAVLEPLCRTALDTTEPPHKQTVRQH
jgi:hypothetical protein